MGERIRQMITAAALAAGLIGLTFLLIVPTYRTNDDASLSMLAAGVGMASSPEEHLLFLNVAIGLVLQALYSLYPGGLWYPLVLVFFFFASFAFLLHVLLSRRSWKCGLVLLFFYGLLGVEYMAGLQFTMVAFWSGTCGALALFLLLSGQDERERPPLPLLLIACLFLFVCSLIRFQSLYLVGIVTAPLLAAGLWATPSRTRRTAIWGLLATAVLCFGAERANRLYYAQDPGWTDFYEINQLRANLQEMSDDTLTPRRRAALARAGWSEQDYAMLRVWFYADAEKFTLENFRMVASEWTPETLIRDPRQALSSLEKVFFNRYFLILIFSIAARLLFFEGGAASRQVLLVSAAAGLGPIAASPFFLKPAPFHVYFPVYSYLVLISLLGTSLPDSSAGRVRRWAACLCIGLWVVAGADGVRLLIAKGAQAERNHAALRTDLQRLGPAEDQLFVVWGGSNLYDDLLPFRDLQFLRPLKVLAVAAAVHSPPASRRMKEFQIGDLQRDLFKREDVFLMCRAPRWRQLFKEAIQKNYAVSIDYRTCFEGERVTVVQPRPASKALPAANDKLLSLKPIFPEGGVIGAVHRSVRVESRRWVVSGPVPDRNNQRLLRTRRRQLSRGDAFVAKGRLWQGSFYMVLRDDRQRREVVQVGDPGDFTIVLAAPQEGSYDVLLGSAAKSPRNDFVFTEFGWVQLPRHPTSPDSERNASENGKSPSKIF